MPFFDRPDVRRSLEITYRLRQVQSPFHTILPLFTRTFPASSKLAFHLPYGYTPRASALRQKLEIVKWGDLKAFSLESRKNIILRSIGELDINSGQLTAYHSTLDLKPGLLAINSNLSKNFKNNLNWQRNRALKQKIAFAVETHDLAISEFHNLLAKQCLRYHKMLFQPLGLFQEFINLNIAKIYTARSNGTLIGGIYVLFDSNTAYYGWGARDTNNSLGVHTLLINMLIENSIMLEMHEVDFGLTAIDDKDLLQYKLKWGVNTNSVFTYSTADSSPIFDLHNGFPITRNIYSRLPLNLAKIITPKILCTLIH